MALGAKTCRPPIMGRHGAVASNHPAATQVGLDVLRAGGNAIDAAVATSLALGVAEPHMSGLGGDGFYNVWLAASDVSTIFAGCGAAPASADPTRFADGLMPSGPLAVSVPGALAGLGRMHAAHGSMSWRSLCQPAIGLAREGVPVTHTYRHFAANAIERLQADPVSAGVYLQAGGPPTLGTLLRQPALGDTLDRVAEEGMEGFYRGALALALTDALRQSGVAVTAADLAACHADVRAPISIRYRGYDVRQTPPPSTGFVLLQQLKILECFDLATLDGDGAALVHLMVEAKKLAFLDRERYAGEAVANLEYLLSDERGARLAAAIDIGRATPVPLSAADPGDGDTTYFAIVDAEGNAVSAIQSLNNAFGSGVTAAGTGILLNNRMTCWHLDPAHPNALRPAGRVRHTMNAPMVFRDGRPWALLGTPGADNQVQINLQALVGLIDFGLDPQQVAEAPRWTSDQPGQEANWPHGGDDLLTLESDFPETTIGGLRDRGHRVRLLPPLSGPCSLACIRIFDHGVRVAGSDPRRDGWAGAY